MTKLCSYPITKNQPLTPIESGYKKIRTNIGIKPECQYMVIMTGRFGPKAHSTEIRYRKTGEIISHEMVFHRLPDSRHPHNVAQSCILYLHNDLMAELRHYLDRTPHPENVIFRIYGSPRRQKRIIQKTKPRLSTERYIYEDRMLAQYIEIYQRQRT